MSWEAWVLVVLTVGGVIGKVWLAGKERKPWPSGGELVVGLICDALLLWLVLRLADVL